MKKKNNRKTKDDIKDQNMELLRQAKRETQKTPQILKKSEQKT